MQCGHAFCNDCWRQHCVTQIGDGHARKLPCMGVRCATVCDEDKVHSQMGLPVLCFTCVQTADLTVRYKAMRHKLSVARCPEGALIGVPRLTRMRITS